MESFLKNIIERIGTALPQLGTVDEDYGQLEEGNDTYPVTFPAVLIDAPQIQWDNIGELAQKGLATLTVKLLIDCYDDSHYGAKDAGRRSMERESLCNDLHWALQGFAPDEYATPLVRLSSRYYTAGHGIKIYEAMYSCEVGDALNEPVTSAKGIKAKI